METTEREVHINNLIALKDFCNNNGAFTLASNIEQSLDYAISSLKTDLKYDLMYEREEIYTKVDVVAILKEIQLECEENTVRWYVGRVDGKSDDVVLMETINDIIQQKINSLKENRDEKK